MRYLLDTSVLSEPGRPRPDSRVVDWLRAQSSVDLAMSVLTLGEIQQGIHLMRRGQRRAALEAWLATDLPAAFSGRLLLVDTDVARRWGTLSAEGRKAGRPLPVIDGLLLATAATHHLTFVTRNEADCEGRGVPIFNPWNS